MSLKDGAKVFLSARNGKMTEEGEGEVCKTQDGKTFILHDFDIGFYHDPNPPADMRGFRHAYYVAEQDDLHGWAFIDH